MSGLSEQDRLAIEDMRGCGCCSDRSGLDHLLPDSCTAEDGYIDHAYADGCNQMLSMSEVVEAIVARAVNAALTDAANAIEATSDQRERDLRIPIGEVDAYTEAADIVRARRT